VPQKFDMFCHFALYTNATNVQISSINHSLHSSGSKGLTVTGFVSDAIFDPLEIDVP